MNTRTHTLVDNIVHSFIKVRRMVRCMYRTTRQPILIYFLAITMVLAPNYLIATPPEDDPAPSGVQPPQPPPQCKSKSCHWKRGECEKCEKGTGSTGATKSCYPIHLRFGTALESAIDLQLASTFDRWTMERSYESNSTGSSALGNKWMGGVVDQKLVAIWQYDVQLIISATSAITFQNPVVNNQVQYIYQPPPDTGLRMEHDSGNDQYVVTNVRSGQRDTYHDFTVTNANHRGKLKEASTREWFSQGKTGYEYSYDTNGKLSQITTPEGQDYNLAFTFSGNFVSKVEVQDLSSNVLERVEYTYYDDVTSPSTDLGSTGDLVQVKVSRQSPSDSTGTLSIIDYIQYRYDGDSKIKAIYEHGDIQRIISEISGISSETDILSKADDYGTPDVDSFASKGFTYYSSATSTSSIDTPFTTTENLNTTYGATEADETGMVKSETIGSGCSSCGSSGSAMTKTYFYLDIDQGATLDQNEVVRIVIEDTEDADGNAIYRTIVGLNDTGRELRRVFIDDPTGSPSYWCNSTKMEPTGKEHRIAESRNVSAHNVSTAANLKKFLDPYDSEGDSWANDSDTLNASDGVITVFTYNSDGVLTDSKVKKGKNGTAYYLSASDYATDEDHVRVTASYTYPTKTTSRTAGNKTSYSYTYWDTEEDHIKTKTIAYPVIPTSQNGSGVASTNVEYYDDLGRLRWTKDGEGYISYYSYHPDHGGQALAVVDVDPSSPGSEVTVGSSGEWEAWTVGDANNNKPTRDSGLPTALTHTSKTYYDDQGTAIASEDHDGSLHYTVMENDRVIQFSNWDSTSGTTLEPIQITQYNEFDQITDLISVKIGFSSISTSGGAPTGFSTDPSQSDYVSWTKNTYDATSGQLQFVDRYHNIPSSGIGTLDTNFYRTVFQYDSWGRTEYVIQVVNGSSAGDRKEQVTQRVYDNMGRVIEVKRGVSGDSDANSHNMTDDYDTYPTLYTIKKTEYDEGGVGDGHITKDKKYHGTGANDYIGHNYKRTYRGNIRATEQFYMNGSTETSFSPYVVNDINWEGSTIATAVFDSAPTWSTVLTGDGFTDYASTTATNRRALETIEYDNLSRIFHIKRYKVTESSGAASQHIDTDYYFDRNNRRIGVQPAHAVATETAYDGLGRVFQNRTVLALNSAKYSSGTFQYRDPQPHSSISSMTGGDDWVLELLHIEYTGNRMTGQHKFEIVHDDTTSSTRGIDLSNNDDYIRGSVYYWHDEAGRLTAQANYGSGDTASGPGQWKYSATPTRPSTAPTASSDSKLVTLYSYNADTGRSEGNTNPIGIETRTFFDDLGRAIYVVENYDDFVPSTEANTGDPTDVSKDRVTKNVYNGGTKLLSIVATDPDADGNQSDNQTTTYLFEDVVNTSRVTNAIFPDSADTNSSGTDQISIEYNIDGSLAKRTDQRGTVLEYTYTPARRMEMNAATTLGSGTDGHVRALKADYDSLGRVDNIISYSSSDGTGTVRNALGYSYNEFGQPLIIYQSHEGSVNTSSTLSVEHTYDDTVTSNVFTRQHRLESITYPDGRNIFFDYDSGNPDYADSRLSRVKRIRDNDSTGDVFCQYDYFGLRHPAIVDYSEPDFKLDLFQGTSGTYAGIDRFGRIVDQYWDGYESTVDVDRFKYAYNTAGNRKYRDIDSSIYANDDHDQAHTYDGLRRLLNTEVGTLSGATISGTPAEQETWVLNSLDSWSTFTTKTSGTADLVQSRTTNDANEISNITETTGSAWATPDYDLAGNMTTMPKPTDLTNSFAATYDAWNRLVKIADGATTVAEYEYDGMGHRIVKSVYTSGTLDHRKHYYYNSDWQVLEVRKETSGVEDSDPIEQLLWHPFYVDALILVDYDEDTDGVSERHYFSFDSGFNITAAVGSSGSVVERYRYTSYGTTTILEPNFSIDSDGFSDIGNEITFTGRRYDSETGLFHFRSRNYHAELGTFTTRDPLGYADGNNSYAAYFIPDGLDPTGEVKIKCECYESSWFWNNDTYWVTTECGGLAAKCCNKACPSWTGQWKKVGASDDGYIGGSDQWRCEQECKDSCWQRFQGGSFGHTSPIAYGQCIKACPGQCSGQNTDGGFYTVEGGIGIVGGGIANVTCCDEKTNKWKHMKFYKGCLGLMAGISGSGGYVHLNKGCNRQSYEGWFIEIGGAAGPVTGGFDQGLDDSYGWLPGGSNGTFEVAGGMTGTKGGGFSGKGALCRYVLDPSATRFSGCCK